MATAKDAFNREIKAGDEVILTRKGGAYGTVEEVLAGNKIRVRWGINDRELTIFDARDVDPV